MSAFDNVDVILWVVFSALGIFLALGGPVLSRRFCPETCGCWFGASRGGVRSDALGVDEESGRAPYVEATNPATGEGGGVGSGGEGGKSGRGFERSGEVATCCGVGQCGLGYGGHAAVVVGGCLFGCWLVVLVLLVAVFAGLWDSILFTPVVAADCQKEACTASDADDCCSYVVEQGRLGGGGYAEPRDVWISLSGKGKEEEGVHAWLMVNDQAPTGVGDAREEGEEAHNATEIGGGADGWLNILYAHGSGANLASNYRQGRYNFLLSLGKVRLLVFDFPGYGKSTGSLDGATFLPAAERSLLAFRAIVNASESEGWPGGNTSTDALVFGDAELKEEENGAFAPGSSIILLGRSMGGPVVATLGAKAASPSPRGMILQSTFGSIASMVSISMPLTGFASGPALEAAAGFHLDAYVTFPEWAEEHTNAPGAASLPPCAFVSHSAGDEWANPAGAKAMFQQADLDNPPPATVPAKCATFHDVKPDSTLHSDPMTQGEKKALKHWANVQRYRLL